MSVVPSMPSKVCHSFYRKKNQNVFGQNSLTKTLLRQLRQNIHNKLYSNCFYSTTYKKHGILQMCVPILGIICTLHLLFIIRICYLSPEPNSLRISELNRAIPSVEHIYFLIWRQIFVQPNLKLQTFKAGSFFVRIYDGIGASRKYPWSSQRRKASMWFTSASPDSSTCSISRRKELKGKSLLKGKLYNKWHHMRYFRTNILQNTIICLNILGGYGTTQG